jgi:hypothetical protein
MCPEVGGLASRRQCRFEVGALILQAAGVSSRRARRSKVGGIDFEAAALFQGRSPCL